MPKTIILDDDSAAILLEWMRGCTAQLTASRGAEDAATRGDSRARWAVAASITTQLAIPEIQNGSALCALRLSVRRVAEVLGVDGNPPLVIPERDAADGWNRLCAAICDRIEYDERPRPPVSAPSTRAIRVTLSSASYDEDQTYVVWDTPRVRRALELRQQVIDATGDGTNEVDDVGSIPDTTEAEFIDAILLDLSDDGTHDDEQRAYIDGVR